MTVAKQGFLGIDKDYAVSQAPAKVIAQSQPIDRVIIAISNNKSTERLIPRALEVAQENDVELTVVHVYKSSAKRYTSELGLAQQTDVIDHSHQQAEQYLRSIKSKLTSQYHSVSAYLFEGMDSVSAITTIAEECKHPHIIVAKPEPRRILRMITKNEPTQLNDILGDKAEIEKI